MAKGPKAESTPAKETYARHVLIESTPSIPMPPPATRPHATPVQPGNTGQIGTNSSSKKKRRRGKRGKSGKDSFNENATTLSEDTTTSSTAPSPLIQSNQPPKKKIRTSSSQLRDSISAEEQPIFNKEPELFGVYEYSSGDESDVKQAKQPKGKSRTRVQTYSPSVQEPEDESLSTDEASRLKEHRGNKGRNPKSDSVTQDNMDSEHISAAKATTIQPTKLSSGRYTCPLKAEYSCTKTFSSAKIARRHADIHTGATTYRCDICGKGFYRQDKLKLHSNSHEKASSIPVERSSLTKLEQGRSRMKGEQTIESTPDVIKGTRDVKQMYEQSNEQLGTSDLPMLSASHIAEVTSAESETESETEEDEKEEQHHNAVTSVARNSASYSGRSQSEHRLREVDGDETASDSDDVAPGVEFNHQSSTQRDQDNNLVSGSHIESLSPSILPRNKSKRKRKTSTAPTPGQTTTSRKRARVNGTDQLSVIDVKHKRGQNQQESNVSSQIRKHHQNHSAHVDPTGEIENDDVESKPSTETGFISSSRKASKNSSHPSKLPAIVVSVPQVKSSMSTRLSKNEAKVDNLDEETTSHEDEEEDSNASDVDESASEEDNSNEVEEDEYDYVANDQTIIEESPKAKRRARRSSIPISRKNRSRGAGVEIEEALPKVPPQSSDTDVEDPNPHRRKKQGPRSEGSWAVVSKTGQVGRFSDGEIQTLLAWRDSFCNEYELTHTDFNNVMTASLSKQKADWSLPYMTKRDFMQQYYDQLPHRNRRAMLRFRERHFQNVEKTPWTADDDKELLDLVRQHGPKWTEIGQMMGRTQDFVSQRWRHKLNYGQETTRGDWSVEESMRLEEEIEAIAEAKGTTADDESLIIPWNIISQRIGNGRTAQQCSNKWRVSTTRRVNGKFVKVPLNDRIPGSAVKAPRTSSKMSRRLSGDPKKTEGLRNAASDTAHFPHNKQYKSAERVVDSEEEADNEMENEELQNEEGSSTEEVADRNAERREENTNANHGLVQASKPRAQLKRSSQPQNLPPVKQQPQPPSRSKSQRASVMSPERGPISRNKVQTPGTGQNLTQLFHDTQASSSPKQTTGKKSAVSRVPDSIMPDRPSPEMSIRRRPLSSPLRLLGQQSEYDDAKRDTTDAAKSPQSFVSAQEKSISSKKDNDSIILTSNAPSSSASDSESESDNDRMSKSGESASETESGSTSESSGDHSDNSMSSREKPHSGSQSSFWQGINSTLRKFVPGSQQKATMPKIETMRKNKKRTLADALRNGQSFSQSDANDDSDE